MLLWRYKLKCICHCTIWIQCTWKLRKFLWRTDRGRRFLWRYVTRLKFPEKVLASTVAACEMFHLICVYWYVPRIGLWNTTRKIACIVLMKIVSGELISKFTAYVLSRIRVIQRHILAFSPIPMAARSKAWVCGCSLAGITGLIPAGCMDVLSLMSVVCCQVLVSASGWSLVQRSPTECGMSECDRSLRQWGGLVPLELLYREKEETLAFPEHNFIILTNRCPKVACKFCLFLVENIWCLRMAVVFQNQLN
jgi:hypothetical protein